ncbi:phosphatase [Corynebacterium phocae]|uniref:Phosphatase n=2 Tax=Corynebacterium phocae TaxID=161895 RepID=A0A1L7D3M0_9CORY|nr:phosphatase [Corynebacterium phocae]
MDGTLTDSEPLWEKATYYLSSLLGRELTPEVRERTVGATFDTTFAILAEYAGYIPKPGDREFYREKMFDHVKQSFARNSAVFPGVKELLNQLRSDGIPMLITTNTQRAVAQPVIEDIGSDFFIDTICGDEVPVGKPAPDMYLEAARRVGHHPGDCLVFEDSFNGMQAAVSAGCVTIGLPADPTAPLPVGAVAISRFTDQAGSGKVHLAGVDKEDLYQWFSALRCR